ncbi:hypothetical protein K7577_003867 [Salmonella enterica]|nr:hypothetical protein [Salmonella enterica]EIB0084296.1 hypothetical protein [Salmonella enterica]
MNIQGKYIKYEDYVALEEKCAALSDDNDKAMEAMKQANEAVKLAHSKYSELAAENAALKSALNDILQPDAAVLERNHRARALDAMETPATDAFLAEVRAHGVEMFSEKFGGGTQLSDMVKEVAKDFAAQLRKGVQS